MAALVESTLETIGSPDKDSNSSVNLDHTSEVLHLKDAKLNKRGIFEIKSKVHSGPAVAGIVKTETGAFGKRSELIRKKSSQDGADSKTDGSRSRPLTGITQLDSKSVDEEKYDRIKSPMSVRVERKPIHNQQPARAMSEYVRGSGGSARGYPVLTGHNHIEPLPTPPVRKELSHNAKNTSYRPKLIRLATVSMSARNKPTSRGQISSLYYEEPRKPKKVIGWDDANNARPPLRIDMEGPGPWAYSPIRKPLNETNSPAWTFGSKCDPEKPGTGSRTSWEKPWFQSPHIWQQKTDFYNDTSWPTPNKYKQKSLLGPRQRTVAEAPSFSIGTRKEFSIVKKGADKDPSPDKYEKSEADRQMFVRGPSFTHQFRRSGTILWSATEKTPGPAAYSPKSSYNKVSGPAFTIRSLRREKSHTLGPYATF